MIYYSYVYRITNTERNKHYYGSRICNMNNRYSDIAIEDLKQYKSSSSNNEFKRLLEDSSGIFKFKIIKKFTTKAEAIKFEAKLHKKFDVKSNDNFYNKSNQGLTSFDFQERVICKHCNESINLSNINRFHNDNCLKNPNKDIEEIKSARKFKNGRKKVSQETKDNISKATKDRNHYVNIITNNKILANPLFFVTALHNKFTNIDDLNIDNWRLRTKKEGDRDYILAKYITDNTCIRIDKKIFNVHPLYIIISLKHIVKVVTVNDDIYYLIGNEMKVEFMKSLNIRASINHYLKRYEDSNVIMDNIKQFIKHIERIDINTIDEEWITHNTEYIYNPYNSPLNKIQ